MYSDLYYFSDNKNYFRTPRIRRSILDATPRTPTPFKNALAEIEKKNGALAKVLVSIN